MSRTDNRRIYAIGDVHGCIDLVRQVQADILADLKNRPHPDPLILFVGDYTDRGPDSLGVIDHLMSMQTSGPESIFLFGNHDLCFLDYLNDPFARTSRLHWLNSRMGGDMTLASYGVVGASEHAPERTHSAFVDAVPDSHIAFLQGLPTTCRVGDYLFVHAGIRPYVALEKQDIMDLIWIRDGFLDSSADHGFKVVHGHTVVQNVELHPNRIAIDTGAVFGGPLSCLVLEDERNELLADSYLVPLLLQHT
jgi:serine/threonine protein phosphatase 1